MSASLSFTATSRCSGVVIVDALSPGDLQTARRMYEDLVHLKGNDDSPYFHYRRASTLDELLGVLSEVRQWAATGFRPIIHIEGHGDADRGLQIGEHGESIGWRELGHLFRQINVLTRNHLGVVLAACQSANQLDALDITQPCPFYFLVAAPQTVQAGFIEDRMRVFYQTLLSTASLDRALGVVTPHFAKFHSERYYCVAFARYLRDHCSGKEAKRRVEGLLSRLMQRGIGESREQRRAVRKKLKTYIRNPEQHFYRKARVFLHGRRTVKYEDVHRFARGADA